MATTIHDAAGSDPILQLQANGAGTEKLTVTAGGKVGIGTTTPGAIAEIKNSVTVVDLKVENTDNATAGSRAEVLVQTGGSNGGDPQIAFTIAAAQSWAIGNR